MSIFAYLPTDRTLNEFVSCCHRGTTMSGRHRRYLARVYYDPEQTTAQETLQRQWNAAQGLMGADSVTTAPVQPGRPAAPATKKLSIRRIPKQTSQEEFREWLRSLNIMPENLHAARENHRDPHRHVLFTLVDPLPLFSYNEC